MTTMLDYERLADEIGLQQTYYGGENGAWLRACCPLHDESRPSFGISTESGVYKCFVCGSGTVDDLISRIYAVSRQEAREWLVDKCALDEDALLEWLKGLKRRHKDEEKRINRSFYESSLLLFKPRLRHFKTLFDRGFTYDALEHLECGYDILTRRITFPVRDLKGRLVGMTGRSILDNPRMKWKIYWKFAKSAHLYHAHQCIRNAPLLIVEGPLDVARAVQYGWNNVVATLSAHPSQKQIDVIRSLRPKYVISALDNDYAGEIGTRVLLDNLLDEVPIFYANYPKNLKDVGDSTSDQFLRMVATKKDAVMSKIINLKTSVKWDMFD
jgi:DNA primase